MCVQLKMCPANWALKFLPMVWCPFVVFTALIFHDIQATAEEDVNENSRSAVLVELFTSEGCSSCPPADDNLKRLAKLAEEKGFPIYTLSYHVDYWDYLGWKDRFSSAAATKRQRQYASAFRSSRIYTPQFVVNGQWEFVGSNRAHTRSAILEAMNQDVAAEIKVSAMAEGSKIVVQFSTSDASEGDRLVIALAINSAESKVTKGENSGRTLNHIHVVQDFKEMVVSATEKVSFEKPEGFTEDGYHVLAYVQSSKNFSLLGIQKVDIKPSQKTGAEFSESQAKLTGSSP